MLAASVFRKQPGCKPSGRQPTERILGLLLALLVTGFIGISVCGADTQKAAPASKSPEKGEKAHWSRTVMIGASAPAGFIESEPFGGPTTSRLRLDPYLDAALVGAHEPVRNFASAMFFMQPEQQGQSQSERALQSNPSFLVALDFLFWFCYGDGSTDKERLARFEQGLKLLEPFRC